MSHKTRPIQMARTALVMGYKRQKLLCIKNIAKFLTHSSVLSWKIAPANGVIVFFISVVYWPPTQTTCQNKKCTCVNNRCIRSKISRYNLDRGRVELSANCDAHKKKVSVEQLHNPGETGGSDQLERRCWNENHVPAEVGPPGPRLSSLGEREINTVMAKRVGVNMLQFCSVSNSPFVTLSNFRIKWEVYFSKELCPLVFIVSSLWFCMHWHMSMQHIFCSLYGNE